MEGLETGVNRDWGEKVHMPQDEYTEPEVVDYGSLNEITEASGFVNEEDGGSKLLIHHVPPDSNPSGP